MSGLYGIAGSAGKGGNFIETMIHLDQSGKSIRVVDDQILTPTNTKEAASKIWEIISTDIYGIYHCTNTGECSWFEFAQEIFNQMGFNPELSPQTTADSGAKASRPAYSVLDNNHLREIGLKDMRHWKFALNEYLIEKHGVKTILDKTYL